MIDVTSLDLVDRPPVSENGKSMIRDALAAIPKDKKSALVAIYDIETRNARLHYAWKINDTWKVGAQVGWTLHEKPTGFVSVEAAW